MHVAFATDVGREREHNEDTGLVRSFPGGHLLIVCDGMGGHAAGDVASQEACTAILEVLAGSINSGRADEDPAGTLLRALTVANNQVLARAEEIGQRSMGTTAVVALVLDKMAWVGWVGDSRLYHLREGRVEHRTEDHTRVQEMVRHGILTPDQAESHPDGHILTMAIGGGSGAQAHFKPSVWSEPIALGDEDVLLLCSDGLHDLLADDEMSEIMGGQPADWAVRALIDEANSRGGHDNISVALLSVSPMIPNVPVPEPTYVEPIAEPDSEPPSDRKSVV